MLIKINDLVETILRVLGGLLFSTFIITVLFQVFARNFIAMSFVWTDEIAMFCFVWSVFVGTAIGYRQGLHYVVEIFPEYFIRTNKVLKLLALILGFPLIWVMATSGWDYAQLGWRRYSFSLGFPLFYQNVVVAISGATMILFTIEIGIRDILAFRTGEPVRKESIE
ncbi:TRAP transporter small permease [Pelagibacterium sp.]|uniref:TRAP transporter small permease n=1 Tax=Pelagibacterium sp. TaxID=1967288 RepID=UPI003BAACBA2